MAMRMSLRRLRLVQIRHSDRSPVKDSVRKSYRTRFDRNYQKKPAEGYISLQPTG